MGNLRRQFRSVESTQRCQYFRGYCGEHVSEHDGIVQLAGAGSSPAEQGKLSSNPSSHWLSFLVHRSFPEWLWRCSCAQPGPFKWRGSASESCYTAPPSCILGLYQDPKTSKCSCCSLYCSDPRFWGTLDSGTGGLRPSSSWWGSIGYRDGWPDWEMYFMQSVFHSQLTSSSHSCLCTWFVKVQSYLRNLDLKWIHFHWSSTFLYVIFLQYINHDT